MSNPNPPRSLDPLAAVALPERRLARDLVAALFEGLDIPQKATVLVHSAFRRLADAGHSAPAVVDALVDRFAAGTLLMPTMSWRSVNPANPVFDELATAGITGVMSEIFRQRRATRRSLHPTHSVAGAGERTNELLGFHHLADTPCHARSPWGLLAPARGWVVLVGVGMERCTLIHHVEEMVAPDLYLNPPESRERYLCRDRQGGEFEVFTRRHRRLRRNFHIFAERLDSEGGMRFWRRDGIEAMAFRADAMVATATAMLQAAPDIILTVPTDRPA